MFSKGSIKNAQYLRNGIFILILAILSIISLNIGVESFSFKGFLSGSSSDSFVAISSRIPRLISILIAGSSLSIAGLIMQTITNNKFVSPSTAGTMEFSKFGVMIAILFMGGASFTSKIIFAFLCSLIGSMFFIKILKKVKPKDPMLVPLIGIMLGNVVNAITMLFAVKFDIAQNISSWLNGSFSLVAKGNYEILYIGIPFFLIAYIYADRFTIAGMGESFSKNLGLNSESITKIGLAIVALISSAVVVSVGSIPFVGLIIPNIVSMYRGDNIKSSIFETAAMGAGFVLICDILGRVLLFPYEISVSVVISVLGSIIFLFMIFRRYRYAEK